MAAWAVWGRAGERAWENLARLILVNLGWLALAWPLITLGAATLGAYAWLRRAVLEREELLAERVGTGEGVPPVPFLALLRDVRRLWWPGTLWWLALLLFLGLEYANFAFWTARLANFGDVLTVLMLGYLAWFWLALQPFWLDALCEGVSFRRALGESLRIVAAYPLYAHLSALPPLALLALGLRFATFLPVVGVSALLLFWACVATGDPRPKRRTSVSELM